MKLLKSIAAILVGILFVFVLPIGTDIMLEKSKVYPPIATVKFETWIFLLALVYRFIYATASGYITAALAPRKRMRHVMIVGYISVTASIVSAIVTLGEPNQWYAIALSVAALPCVWAGGLLRKRVRSIRNNKAQL